MGEPNYFRSFRVPKNVINVYGVGENPSRLVQSAIELKNQDEYDDIHNKTTNKNY